MSEFGRAMALTPQGGGVYGAVIDPAWAVGRAPNGGYVAALGASAMAVAAPHPDPFSVTTHYLRRLETGPVEVHVDVIRTGRSLSTLQARIVQEGAEGARMLGVFGDLDAIEGPSAVLGTPPELPPPDQLPASGMIEGLPEVVYRFDLRIDPAHLGGLAGAPTGGGEVAGWIRFADGHAPDPLSLLVIADAGPPAALNLTEAGWVPTLELTVHVRARPVPGWLRATFRTRFLMNGYLEEDGEIWDADGTLVALSRQLARVHRPRSRSS